MPPSPPVTSTKSTAGARSRTNEAISSISSGSAAASRTVTPSDSSRLREPRRVRVLGVAGDDLVADRQDRGRRHAASLCSPRDSRVRRRRRRARRGADRRAEPVALDRRRDPAPAARAARARPPEDVGGRRRTARSSAGARPSSTGSRSGTTSAPSWVLVAPDRRRPRPRLRALRARRRARARARRARAAHVELARRGLVPRAPRVPATRVERVSAVDPRTVDTSALDELPAGVTLLPLSRALRTGCPRCTRSTPRRRPTCPPTTRRRTCPTTSG